MKKHEAVEAVLNHAILFENQKKCCIKYSIFLLGKIRNVIYSLRTKVEN